MYEPQEGTWTLTAPDGRQWTGASGLRAAAAEQNARIPATVQLERIFAACEPTQDEKDAERYRWLKENGNAFYNCCHYHAPEKLDEQVDAAMLKTPNAELCGGTSATNGQLCHICLKGNGMSQDLIDRLRLGDGSSPDHALLIEASYALEHLLSELVKGLKNEEALQNKLLSFGICTGGTRKNACNLGEAN